MKASVLNSQKVNLNGHSGDCVVHTVHVKVKNIKSRATSMINTISDTSWITNLNCEIIQAAYEARAEKTIDKLVNKILKKVRNRVTADFGEYMVSDVAQCVLNSHFQHTKVPLAELWKEKLKNNMGFDFHTENQSSKHIVFGEAKYSGSRNPYNKAVEQIIDFIKAKKDTSELLHLKNFVSKAAAKNAKNDKKSFVVAFSVNADDPKEILKKAFSATDIDKLMIYAELYLIGVEVDA